MPLKLTNNAFGTLAASITSSGTSITLTTGQGARFPTLGASDYFYATLVDTSNNLEIVKCTARSTDVLTVVRAQESTTGRAYSTGDRIEIRLTAQTFLDATAITPAAVSDQSNASTGYFQLPKGTTAQRPASPATGMVRFNTDLNYLEEYRQGQWLAVSNVFVAEGGTVTTYSSGGTNYKVHTFTSSGTFTVLSGTSAVDYLVVAGGGGGGARHAGGGGAGGLLQGSFTAAAGSLAVVVGGGGAGSNTGGVVGASGGNSSVFTFTAIGGGGGGSFNEGNTTSPNGISGGSGGGGANGTGLTISGGGGAGTSGQGNAGGTGQGGAEWAGGGGGGAGGSGQTNPNSNTGGAGGTGVQSSINGTALFYAGGGGGGGGGSLGSGGAGGSGVGGTGSADINSGSLNPAQSGVTNRGGGGGGHRTSTGGSGGSGIVVIRYQI